MRRRIINVLSFGAMADGINNDADAVQAAVNHAIQVGAINQDSIYFPPGNYLFLGPVDIPNNCQLEGAGDATVLQTDSLSHAGTVVAFNVASGAIASLLDMKLSIASAFVGTAVAVTGGSAYFTNVTLEDVQIGTGIVKSPIVTYTDPRNFGAKFDGVTDDTDAILASIAAAVQSSGAGSVILFPEGKTVVSDTLRVASISGLQIQGQGIRATEVSWAGVAGIPLFEYDGTQDCALTDMRITVDSGTTLAVAVQVGQDTGTLASTRHRIERLQVLGAGRMGIGVYYKLYDTDRDSKNDLHIIHDSQIQSYTDRGVVIEGYNAKKLIFTQLHIQGRTFGQIGLDTGSIAGHGGSFEWYGGECQENDQWDFRFGKPNDPIVVSGVYSQTSARWFTILNDTGGPQPTEFWPITFQGHKWSTTNANLPADKIIVDIKTPGPVSIQGSKIGANAAFGTLRIQYQPQRVSGFATGDLTVSGAISAGETVTLGTDIYTWRATLVDGGLPYEVLIGATVAASLENLESAVNAEEGDEGIVYGLDTVANQDASANRLDADTIRATALSPGVAGNSIASTTTMANGVWSGATLSGGAASVFENIRGSFSMEDTMLSSAQDDEDIFTALPPDSVKGSMHYDGEDFRWLLYGQGQPYEADWFVAQRDQDWLDRGMPVPRVWHLADRSTGYGDGLVLDMQKNYRTLDLHPYNMSQAQYQQAIAPWTGDSITSTGALGQGMVLDDDDNLIDTINTNVAMAGYFKLSAVAANGTLMVIGGGAVGAGNGPFIRQNVAGTLSVLIDGVTTTGAYNYIDGNEHVIIGLIDHGDAVSGASTRMLVITDQEVITGTYSASVQSVAGKGIGTSAGGQATWIGSWRKFWVWTGADVRRIISTTILSLLRGG